MDTNFQVIPLALIFPGKMHFCFQKPQFADQNMIQFLLEEEEKIYTPKEQNKNLRVATILQRSCRMAHLTHQYQRRY